MSEQSTARQTLICVGDSITRGNVSANYVTRVSDMLDPMGVHVVNAGVNGDLAENVLRRLDDIIAQRPDAVTVLVGTNDVNAQFDEVWLRRYRRDQKLTEDPSVATYIANMARILDRLEEATDARIAVLEIPPLGEDLDSRMNTLVAEYNTALRRLAAERRLACLPLNSALVERLPADRTPPPYAGRTLDVMTSGLSHLLLRRNWDDIARRRGLSLLTDHIHLNDKAACVVAQLITDWYSNARRPA